jgi:acyl dehydratase
MAEHDPKVAKSRDDGLVMGKITDDDVAMMRRRIGYPNPSLRKGILQKPWNTALNADAVRRWSECMGDLNPLYNDEDYARASRWGEPVAPPGFEWSMGIDRNPLMDDDFVKQTRSALRGVQLFHSGAEYIYYRPFTEGVKIYKSEVVGSVEEKVSTFGGKSVIVDNVTNWWDDSDRTYVTSHRWFVHTERKSVKKDGEGEPKKAKKLVALGDYSDEDLAEIERAYDAEYIRGADTLWFEDIEVGAELPTMVKGPLTVTDMINFHMGAGWTTYGNPPYRMAYENRKKLRGFYSRNEFGAWDTIQRVHWDIELAHKIGVQSSYDIGPMRFVWLCNYLTNFGGDDSFVHRIRYELRNFNFMGDTSWLTGTVTAKRVDPELGPLIELAIRSVNQRGDENITANATLLVASREHGAVNLPPQPPITEWRRKD